jgi:hypothetical protein
MAKKPKVVSRAEVAAMAKRAGLRLTKKQLDHLYQAAPHMQSMSDRVKSARPREDEPADVFRFPREIER